MQRWEGRIVDQNKGKTSEIYYKYVQKYGHIDMMQADHHSHFSFFSKKRKNSDEEYFRLSFL